MLNTFSPKVGYCDNNHFESLIKVTRSWFFRIKVSHSAKFQWLRWCHPRWRVHAGMATMHAWAVGYMLLACIAYGIRDWFTLQLVIAVPGACLFWYIWCVLADFTNRGKSLKFSYQWKRVVWDKYRSFVASAHTKVRGCTTLINIFGNHPVLV